MSFKEELRNEVKKIIILWIIVLVMASLAGFPYPFETGSIATGTIIIVAHRKRVFG